MKTGLAMKTSLALHKNFNVMEMSYQKSRNHLRMISSCPLFPQGTVTKTVFHSTITSYFVSLMFSVRGLDQSKLFRSDSTSPLKLIRLSSRYLLQSPNKRM